MGRLRSKSGWAQPHLSRGRPSWDWFRGVDQSWGAVNPMRGSAQSGFRSASVGSGLGPALGGFDPIKFGFGPIRVGAASRDLRTDRPNFGGFPQLLEVVRSGHDEACASPRAAERMAGGRLAARLGCAWGSAMQDVLWTEGAHLFEAQVIRKSAGKCALRAPGWAALCDNGCEFGAGADVGGRGRPSSADSAAPGPGRPATPDTNAYVRHKIGAKKTEPRSGRALLGESLSDTLGQPSAKSRGAWGRGSGRRPARTAIDSSGHTRSHPHRPSNVPKTSYWMRRIREFLASLPSVVLRWRVSTDSRWVWGSAAHEQCAASRICPSSGPVVSPMRADSTEADPRTSYFRKAFGNISSAVYICPRFLALLAAGSMPTE